MSAFLLGSTPADLFAPPPAPGSVAAAGLRLALFTDTYVPEMNGVARTLERLVATVRERGGEVCVFAPRGALDERSDPAPEAGVRRYGSRPLWGYPQLGLALPARRAVEAEVRAWRPTLVHAATPFGVGLAGRQAARALGVPLVTSYSTSFSAYAAYYGLGPLAGPGWRYLRWFHNGGARTLCPSRSVRDELTARGFARTRVWGRGVDAERFHPRHRSAAMRARLGAADDGTVVIAYAGRLAREKGLDVLLAAARRVADETSRRVVFAFDGEGPFEAACRRAAPPGSVFTGALAGARLSAFYASADLLAFPSTTDTFGDVLLEAMASGLPVLGVDVGPTRELLGDGRGAMVGAGNPLALATRLLSLVDDAGGRARFARAALAEARARSWDAVFDGLLADYAAARVVDRAAGRSSETALPRRPRAARVPAPG